MHLARLTLDHNRPLHDIRPELTIDVPLGEADVMSELRAFSANFTFRHLNHPYAK
jgi:hypothetical protein